ncbi:MAG: hypothetical protein Q4B87_01060 [Candidatus Saccharibacteria bacterium]|nr:hypothetical protein [Candidatus Saccharibacteria bacterium]
MKKKNASSKGSSKGIHRNRAWIGFFLASAVVLVLVATVAANFGVIKDWAAGLGYRPTAEMEEIRESLGLTGTGRRIFDAVQPELKERDEFNQNCREVENESTILGCYTRDRVFVYNIVDEELAGIKELTTAHELLHAVYNRMNKADKTKWGLILNDVYQNNLDILGAEIDIYPEEQRREELYVRAGTEIKNLPEELERHYAEIFGEQDKIVDFYERYIKVFREIEEKLERLYGEITQLSGEIEQATSEYETRIAALNTAVEEFNRCAGTADCFSSNTEFYTQRTKLISEQTALKELYASLSEKIAKHNVLVAEYNENAVHGQILNSRINSSVTEGEVVGE